LDRRQLGKDLTVCEHVRDEDEGHEVLRVTRDMRRASPRSAHSASPRTLRKCKPRSGSSLVSYNEWRNAVSRRWSRGGTARPPRGR
jgi:hypothetical protein